jgi:hypothetical protein
VALFWVPGRGLVDDQQEDVPAYGFLDLPDGTRLDWGVQGVERLAEYTLPAQFGDQRFQWRPGAHTEEWLPGLSSYAVGYIPQLIDWGEASRAGTLQPHEREQYEQMRQQALAIPTRDWTQLEAGYPGEGGDWSRYLTPSSPDAGAIMLQLDDRIRSGQATGQERQLFDTFLAQMRNQDWRASVPQASDAFNPLSNEFFMALGALGGAVGGAGAFGAFAPVAGAGAGAAGAASAAAPSVLGIPTSTLATIGTLGSYGGTGAGLLGSVTGTPWLQKLGLGLGVAGGLAGGLAGLGNLASTGIRNLGDVARLAGSAGRITGALGRASGVQPLQQASRYLGLGSQLGGVTNLLSAAQGVQEGATQALTEGGRMAEWYDLYPTDMASMPYDDWSRNTAWETFTGWGDPYGPGSSGDVGFTESAGGGGWLGSVLGGLGGFLGKNASWLGPAVSGLTSLGAGAVGANAASDAARLQAAALNRGLDLSTAQWLAQQERSAPWMEAGRGALGQLQTVLGQGQPTLQQMNPVSASAYALPGATLGWRPSTYAGYTPTDTPSAAGYRYTPPGTINPSQYAWNPQAALDPSQYAFTAPTGEHILAQDPGVAFRQSEARKALEASAAARGGLLSGSTLAALQRQGQELASTEYANAYQRWLGENQLRYGRGLTQTQEDYQRQLTANQLGYGRATEQQQLAAQQGLQAAGFNWQSALQEAQARAQQQQFGWTSGFQAQQQGQREAQEYDADLYNRTLAQNQLQYGRDVAERQAYNDLWLQQYNAARLGQQTQANQWSNLAGLGQTTLGQLGQLGATNAQQMANLYGQMGSAQGLSALGPALSWQQALSGGSSAIGNLLKGLNV